MLKGIIPKVKDTSSVSPKPRQTRRIAVRLRDIGIEWARGRGEDGTMRI